MIDLRKKRRTNLTKYEVREKADHPLRVEILDRTDSYIRMVTRKEVRAYVKARTAVVAETVMEAVRGEL